MSPSKFKPNKRKPLYVCGPAYTVEGRALDDDSKTTYYKKKDLEQIIDTFYEERSNHEYMPVYDEHQTDQPQIGRVEDMWVDDKCRLMTVIRLNSLTRGAIKHEKQFSKDISSVGLSTDYGALHNRDTDEIPVKFLRGISLTSTPDLKKCVLEHSADNPDSVILPYFPNKSAETHTYVHKTLKETLATLSTERRPGDEGSGENGALEGNNEKSTDTAQAQASEKEKEEKTDPAPSKTQANDGASASTDKTPDTPEAAHAQSTQNTPSTPSATSKTPTQAHIAKTSAQAATPSLPESGSATANRASLRNLFSTERYSNLLQSALNGPATQTLGAVSSRNNLGENPKPFFEAKSGLSGKTEFAPPARRADSYSVPLSVGSQAPTGSTNMDSSKSQPPQQPPQQQPPQQPQYQQQPPQQPQYQQQPPQQPQYQQQPPQQPQYQQQPPQQPQYQQQPPQQPQYQQQPPSQQPPSQQPPSQPPQQQSNDADNGSNSQGQKRPRDQYDLGYDDFNAAYNEAKKQFERMEELRNLAQNPDKSQEYLENQARNEGESLSEQIARLKNAVQGFLEDQNYTEQEIKEFQSSIEKNPEAQTMATAMLAAANSKGLMSQRYLEAQYQSGALGRPEAKRQRTFDANDQQLAAQAEPFMQPSQPQHGQLPASPPPWGQPQQPQQDQQPVQWSTGQPQRPMQPYHQQTTPTAPQWPAPQHNQLVPTSQWGQPQFHQQPMNHSQPQMGSAPGQSPAQFQQPQNAFQPIGAVSSASSFGTPRQAPDFYQARPQLNSQLKNLNNSAKQRFMSSFNRPPQYQNSPRMGAPRSQSMQEKSQAMETEDEERAAMSKWQATPKKSVAFAVNEGVGDMFDGRAARADMEVCEQSLQRIVQKNPLCRELISSFNKSPPTNLKLSDNKFNLSGASLMKT